MSLSENIKIVNENIDKALKRSGRTRDEIQVIAVTKTVDTSVIKDAIDLGITEIGENRVQELEKKQEVLKDSVNYHMIGHLQSNKAKDIVGKVKLLHSLDRMSLVKELDKRAKNKDVIIDSLVQVNVSEEESKFGLKVEETIDFIKKVTEYKNIRIKGLMTMAPHVDDEQTIRSSFIGLRELKEKIEKENIPGVSMKHLSMGMTNDYEIAIEEGATIVRIGRAIFGDRNY